MVIATGFHLFPFRTEKLSPTAPMVLHTRGRVGRRHFTTSLETRKRLGALLRLDGGVWTVVKGGKGDEEREGMMRQWGERTNSSFSQVCDFYGVVEKMRIKGERLDEKCNFAP